MRLSYIIMCGALATTLCSGIGLASSATFADERVVDKINVIVPVSCTISGTGMNSHNANITNGAYVTDIGTTTIHVFL